MTDLKERRLGALAGAAVGDALGVTYQFMAPSAIPTDRFSMVGGGPCDFAPGMGQTTPLCSTPP